MVESWGRFLAQRARAVLVIGVLGVMAAAAFGIGVFPALSNGGFDDPDTESAKELVSQREHFGGQEHDVVAMYSSPDMVATDPAFESAVKEVVAGLPAAGVDKVVSYLDSGSTQMVSADGHTAMVVVTLAGESQDAKSDSYEEVKDSFEADGLTTHVAGPWAVFGDVNETVTEDIARAESISMPIVFILSLIIFGSVVAALMPTLVGAFAVLGAFAVVRLLSMFTDVSIFAINVITLIGMGLAIDYALFVVSRFREELARQPGDDKEHVRAAIVNTMATAGRTVLFSGLIVAASLASLLIFPQNFLRSMGMGGVAAVLVAMVAALTVLPALLVVLGKRIDAGRMPWLRKRESLETGAHGGWARFAHSVMRRPVVYLSVVLIALLAMGSPFLSAKWGSVDERVLPEDAGSRVASQFQAANFGGETSTANIVVEGADAAQLAEYTAALGQVDGVTSVQPIGQTTTASDAPVTLLQATWPGNGQTQQSQDIVKDLRSVELSGDGTALVGGVSAATVDLVSSIGAHLPWMGLIVVIVMLVLLFLAFGSLVLPIKAVLMNVVSLVASFGVVTWIFQEGHLSGPLGFTSPGYLDATQPILMLGILFGLSMDYEVFLLSRIREEWDRTGDNTASVATGLQRSGRIITSAAILLAVVIAGFATSGIVFLKMIGIGMLVAVIIDATLVRAILVPATMRLLGEVNWWAPAPMKRWWERHGLRESPAPPADEKKLVTAS